jgi:DNA invertase Pin-like site-specific DNA recombinase
MSTSRYVYLSQSVVKFPGITGEQLVAPDQRRRLVKDQECVHLFSETYSETETRRTAFTSLLEALKEAKTKSHVYIWTWACLANQERLRWAASDVQNHLRQIHDCGVSVIFVNENLDTSKATDRLVLATTLANAQYLYDISVENGDKASSSNSCTKAACCSPSAASLSTGC